MNGFKVRFEGPGFQTDIVIIDLMWKKISRTLPSYRFAM